MDPDPDDSEPPSSGQRPRFSTGEPPYVVRFGPLASGATTCAYAGVHSDWVTNLVYADDDIEGVRAVQALVDGEVRCERRLGKAARALHLVCDRMPTQCGLMAGAVAVFEANGKRVGELENLGALVVLLDALARFERAILWRFWDDQARFVLILDGPEARECGLYVHRSDDEEGIVIYAERDLHRLARPPRRGDEDAAAAIPRLGVALESGPLWARRHVAYGLGCTRVPRVIKVSNHQPACASTRDVLELAASLEAVARLGPCRGSSTAVVFFGGWEQVAGVHAPHPAHCWGTTLSAFAPAANERERIGPDDRAVIEELDTLVARGPGRPEPGASYAEIEAFLDALMELMIDAGIQRHWSMQDGTLTVLRTEKGNELYRALVRAGRLPPEWAPQTHTEARRAIEAHELEFDAEAQRLVRESWGTISSHPDTGKLPVVVNISTGGMLADMINEDIIGREEQNWDELVTDFEAAGRLPAHVFFLDPAQREDFFEGGSLSAQVAACPPGHRVVVCSVGGGTTRVAFVDAEGRITVSPRKQ